jgi:hypothetical protein
VIGYRLSLCHYREATTSTESFPSPLWALDGFFMSRVVKQHVACLSGVRLRWNKGAKHSRHCSVPKKYKRRTEVNWVGTLAYIFFYCAFVFYLWIRITKTLDLGLYVGEHSMLLDRSCSLQQAFVMASHCKCHSPTTIQRRHWHEVVLSRLCPLMQAMAYSS